MRQFDINEVRANVPGFFRSVQKEGAIVYRRGYPLAVIVRYQPIWNMAVAAQLEDERHGVRLEVNESDYQDWRDYQARVIEYQWERTLD